MMSFKRTLTEFFVFDRRAGYTLVELIVGMFVFVVAIGLAVGAFIQALRSQRATVHIMGMNSNASIMIEQLAREARTGFNFSVSNDAALCGDYGQSNELSFTNSSRGNEVRYRFDPLAQTLSRMECVLSDCSGKSFEVLSAPDMQVRRACFELLNARKVPRVVFKLQIGSINDTLRDSVVNVQTVVSARIVPSLDL